jgi:hypothetical protein
MEQFDMAIKQPELVDEPTRRLMDTLARNTPQLKKAPDLAESRARVKRRHAGGKQNLSQRDASVRSQKAQNCLDSATYCDDMASHVQDHGVKLSFAESARLWRLLAKQIKRLEKEQKS